MIQTDFIPDTGLTLLQDSRQVRMTSDTLMLGRFLKVRKQDRILDVGTNNGALLLIAGQKTRNTCIGIDISAPAIELARQNAQLNHLGHLSFACVALQEFTSDPFDLIVCNPPYFDKKGDMAHDSAFYDHSLNLKDLATHASRLLKDSGRLAIILEASRVFEAAQLFGNARLSVKRIQSIHHTPDHKATSICLEMVKNGKPGAVIEAPRFHKENL